MKPIIGVEKHVNRTSWRNCNNQLELGQMKKWKFTNFSEDLSPNQKYCERDQWVKEYWTVTIINFKSTVTCWSKFPIQNPIQRISDKRSSFSYRKNCLKNPIISIKVFEFWHNGAIQNTHRIALHDLILTHLPTFFHFMFCYHEMTDGIKYFYNFLLYM